MESGDIAPMVVMLALILVSGGVLIFRPIAKRIGDLLEVMTQQRRGAPSAQEIAQLRELLAILDGRLSLLEERQAFTESLLAARGDRPDALPEGQASAPAPSRVPGASRRPPS